jgi:hypothetical protein
MNKDNKSVLAFFIDDMVVGTFETDQYPKQDGDYKYIPYRGTGHLELQNRLKNNGTAQCKYKMNSRVMTFDVIACPQYGIVTIANVREC